MTAEEFFQSKIVFWLIISGLLANLINWAALWIFIKPVDGNIILHYNVYFGVDMMGNWKLVFIMPSVGLFLFFVNFSTHKIPRQTAQTKKGHCCPIGFLKKAVIFSLEIFYPNNPVAML